MRAVHLACPLAALALLLSASACTVGDPDPDAVAGDGLGGDGQDVGTLAARVCADGPTVQGVDVSYYQGAIDWTKARAAGIQFAFIRVSDGTGFRDPKFATYWAGSRAVGIAHGAYQFFRPNQDPTAQADLLVDTMGPLEPDDLPPVIDVEATGGLSAATVASRVRAWVDRVEARTGRTPIVYTGMYFWRDQVGGSTREADAPLWIAQYTSLCPSLPSPWSRWTFWQYSDHGQVSGIGSSVDVDRFNGTLDDLRALGDGAGFEPFGVAWDRADSGAYTFRAEHVPADVARVDYYIDDYHLGGADAAAGFAITYTFNYEYAERGVEARGTDADGHQVALAVGEIDSIAGTAVFIRQVADHQYEIGLERPPPEVAAIEVMVDGKWLLTDELSQTTRSARGAVRYTFSDLGARTFAISTFDAGGTLRGTLTRTFTLR
jgi:GH25 family lysozyme M1 (1,4-beta-N-acetylmuramidase)